jgi:predicted acetyltransferase
MVAPVPLSQLDEWQQLLRKAFAPRWGNLYRRHGFFLDYVTHDPHFRPGHIMGVIVENRLVSVYQVFRRRMIIGDRAYQLEGLGNVGTDSAFQGKGYGTALLRWYLRRGSKRDIALVYARDGAFYRRMAWRRLKSRTLILPKRSVNPAQEHEEVRWRLAVSRDLPALARIYVRFNRAEGLPHVVRSAAYWKRWVWDWKLRTYRLNARIFVDGGSRPVGYMFLRLSGGTMVVEEYGALPSRRDQVYQAILTAFRQERRAETLCVMRSVGSLERFLDGERIEYETKQGVHETGHAYVFLPVLNRWKDLIGLWHVDHF